MKNILIGLIASLIISTASYAGQFGIGLTGSFAAVSAEGTESDVDGTADTSNRSASAGHNAIVPSAFAEYSLDNGFTIGYDYTIGSAEVSEKNLTRTNIIKGSCVLVVIGVLIYSYPTDHLYLKKI